MTAVQVHIYTPDMTLIAHVPRRKPVKWQDELNAPGMGSLSIQCDDPLLSEHPELLDPFNIVVFSIDGTPRKAWLVERVERSGGEPAEQWWTLTGRGALAILSYDVVYPEYDLRRDSADDRSFDYGSKNGGWKVDADWNVPLSIKVSNPASIRKGFPLHWPDRDARWLWSTDPNTTTANGVNWFRTVAGKFTLTETTRVRIFACGDDAMWLQLDGELIIAKSYGQWRQTAGRVFELAAGEHLIAAAVRTYQQVDPLHSSAFVCSVAKVDRNNKILKWLLRSDPATFEVHEATDPPGWFGPSILKTLVEEAQDRGAEGFAPITFGFTDTDDTDDQPWTVREDRSFPVGKDSLLDVAAKIVETGADIDMSPALELQAWVNRGQDLRDSVRLLIGRDVTDNAPAQNFAPIRTRSLTRHRGGWIEYVDTAAEADFGRRTTGLVAGGTSSDAQAEVFSQSAFDDLGKPETTLPVTTTSQAAQRPYEDYNLGDVVTVPGLLTKDAPARIMAFTVDEDDNGLLSYTLELYPED